MPDSSSAQSIIANFKGHQYPYIWLYWEYPFEQHRNADNERVGIENQNRHTYQKI